MQEKAIEVKAKRDAATKFHLNIVDAFEALKGRGNERESFERKSDRKSASRNSFDS